MGRKGEKAKKRRGRQGGVDLGWLRGAVGRTLSLTGELYMSCARPTVDG